MILNGVTILLSQEYYGALLTPTPNDSLHTDSPVSRSSIEPVVVHYAVKHAERGDIREGAVDATDMQQA